VQAGHAHMLLAGIQRQPAVVAEEVRGALHEWELARQVLGVRGVRWGCKGGALRVQASGRLRQGSAWAPSSTQVPDCIFVCIFHQFWCS